jgi:hypothetical protein
MASQTKNSNKVILAISLILNFTLLTIALIGYIFFATSKLDLAIVNYATSGSKAVNFNGPGGCLYINKELIKDAATIVDASGRVISADGKLKCIVDITPQEADALEQKYKSELNNSF